MKFKIFSGYMSRKDEKRRILDLVILNVSIIALIVSIISYKFR